MVYASNNSIIRSLILTNKTTIQGVNEKTKISRYFDFILKLSENHIYNPANGNIKVNKAKTIRNNVIKTPGASSDSLNDLLTVINTKKLSHNKVKTTVIIVKNKSCLLLTMRIHLVR